MLPDLIEIVPLDKPVKAEITVPGSKSITNRALILAALADGETTLRGALWSEDTQVMANCLEKLGFKVTLKPDPDEFCNRTITVKGLGGKIPNAGTAEKPLELFVGNAGTAARFLSALVCLGNGVYRLHGVPRMHERPQAALFKALRELGYRVESENGNDKLPARISGEPSLSGRRRGDETHSRAESQSLLTSAPTNEKRRSCTVSIEESSQFASALLLCAKAGGWMVNIVGENAEESPYVAMTSKMIEAFPKGGGTYQIEPDASSGSYFLAAGHIAPASEFFKEYSEQFGVEVDTSITSTVRVNNWPAQELQVDSWFDHVFFVFGDFGAFKAGLKSKDMKSIARITNCFSKPGSFSRATDLGDSIMTAIVLSAITTLPPTSCAIPPRTHFTDLGRLRLQETERVVALRTELTRCGAKVVEEGDALTVYPSELHGAEIETYHDHRMAMCFAILGLKVPGIKIKNPACVKKTFPNFFQKLAAAPPHGLGATIRDAKTGRKLEEAELFAD
jgi:3-phosphoshikimate 1-carboxyvinyltransferase